MTALRAAATPDQRPDLFDKIRYEAELEARALESLAQCDLEGCRRAFHALVTGLDRHAAEAISGASIQLLADVLHGVNRRIHNGQLRSSDYHAERAALAEQFGACASFAAARERFMPALERLLAPLGNGDGAQHPLVRRATVFIERNHQRRVSLSSVADSLHVSSNYLSRLFRRETGRTLTAYLHRVRLDHAIALLAEGGRSISEIAYGVGYQNYRDFYRNFVKYENASPRAVRRRLRDESPVRRPGPDSGAYPTSP